MGLLFGFLAGVFILFLLGLCVMGAIWESVRANKDFKKLEQQWRRRRLY
jgi:cell division protein FtsW (lipid II flippase)